MKKASREGGRRGFLKGISKKPSINEAVGSERRVEFRMEEKPLYSENRTENRNSKVQKDFLEIILGNEGSKTTKGLKSDSISIALR